MGWRTVVVSGRAKLDLKLNTLVIRKEKTHKIYIPEIAVLVIDSTTVSITTALIDKLVEEKVKIIFCGRDHNPIGEISNYYNKHNSVKCIKQQIEWNKKEKDEVWGNIVKEKISNQVRVLAKYNSDKIILLTKYKNEVCVGDTTNREGHAAKVYFNSLFGPKFSREQDCPINLMLNFGYAILLSSINREIVSSGYLTQLGIFHKNQFNQYNLGCDFMEPLRPLVDNIVKNYNPQEFTKQEKQAILEIFNKKFVIDKTNYSFYNAISAYCKSLFKALNVGDGSKVQFMKYEL